MPTLTPIKWQNNEEIHFPRIWVTRGWWLGIHFVTSFYHFTLKLFEVHFWIITFVFILKSPEEQMSPKSQYKLGMYIDSIWVPVHFGLALLNSGQVPVGSSEIWVGFRLIQNPTCPPELHCTDVQMLQHWWSSCNWGKRLSSIKC